MTPRRGVHHALAPTMEVAHILVWHNEAFDQTDVGADQHVRLGELG